MDLGHFWDGHDAIVGHEASNFSPNSINSDPFSNRIQRFSDQVPVSGYSLTKFQSEGSEFLLWLGVPVPKLCPNYVKGRLTLPDAV